MSAPTRLLPVLPPAPPERSGWPWTTETPPPDDLHAVQWPRITIVTPSYRQASYLEECVRSILLQNYPALDYRVFDGGSADGSVDILRRYSPWLGHWTSAPDGGQADAINRGFETATGKIFAWINSDDFLLPGALFAVARRFLAGRCDIVYGDALNLHEPGGELDYWQGYWVIPPFLQFGGVLASHATFWRKAVHQPLWTELHCNMDGELWQRLVPGRRLGYLPLPLAVYRAHAATKSQAEAWKEKWRHDDALVWARHGRPTRNRVFIRTFGIAQRIFKWFAWRRNRPDKRAVIEACEWTPPLRWRTPSP